MVNTNQRSTRKEDQALIEAIIDGRPEGFDRLYERFQGRVFGFALRRVGNAADAEEIAQEVFLQVYRSIGSYQGRASLATWIFGIAHNVTCRHFRQRGIQGTPLEACEGSLSLAESPIFERQIDAARAVEKCTETLAESRSPEHLEIFRLFYGLGRPLRAIAEATGKPIDSVKDSLRRSRNLLMRDVPAVRSSLSATAGA